MRDLAILTYANTIFSIRYGIIPAVVGGDLIQPHWRYLNNFERISLLFVMEENSRLN